MAESRYCRIYRKPNAEDIALRLLRQNLEENIQRQKALASCPHILRVFELRDSGDAFIVSHEPAEPLDIVPYDTHRPMPPLATLIDCLQAGASAIEEAYKGNPQLPHGGLTPFAFLRAADGTIKVADFGVAPAYVSAVNVNALLGLAVGPSPHASAMWECRSDHNESRTDWISSYFAIEVLLAGRRFDEFDRIRDLFSLGASLYVIAEARHPYFTLEGVGNPLRCDVTHPGDRIAFNRPELNVEGKPRDWTKIVRRLLNPSGKNRSLPAELLQAVPPQPTVVDPALKFRDALERLVRPIEASFVEYFLGAKVDIHSAPPNVVGKNRDALEAPVQVRLQRDGQNLGEAFAGALRMAISTGELVGAAQHESQIKANLHRIVREWQQAALQQSVDALGQERIRVQATDPPLPAHFAILTLESDYGSHRANAAWDPASTSWIWEDRRLRDELTALRQRRRQERSQDQLLGQVSTLLVKKAELDIQWVDSETARIVAKVPSGQTHPERVTIRETQSGHFQFDPAPHVVARAMNARIREIEAVKAPAVPPNSPEPAEIPGPVPRPVPPQPTPAKTATETEPKPAKPARIQISKDQSATEVPTANPALDKQVRPPDTPPAVPRTTEPDSQATPIAPQPTGPDERQDQVRSKRGVGMIAAVISVLIVATCVWAIVRGIDPGKSPAPPSQADLTQFIRPLKHLSEDVTADLGPPVVVQLGALRATAEWDPQTRRITRMLGPQASQLVYKCAARYLARQSATLANATIPEEDAKLTYDGSTIAGTLTVGIGNQNRTIAFSVDAAGIHQPDANDISELEKVAQTVPREEAQAPEPDAGASATSQTSAPATSQAEQDQNIQQEQANEKSDGWSNPQLGLAAVEDLLSRKEGGEKHKAVGAALSMLKAMEMEGRPQDFWHANGGVRYQKMFLKLADESFALAYVEVSPSGQQTDPENRSELPTVEIWQAVARAACDLAQQKADGLSRDDVLWNHREWCLVNDTPMTIGGITIPMDSGKSLQIPPLAGSDIDEWLQNPLTLPLKPEISDQPIDARRVRVVIRWPLPKDSGE